MACSWGSSVTSGIFADVKMSFFVTIEGGDAIIRKKNMLTECFEGKLQSKQNI